MLNNFTRRISNYELLKIPGFSRNYGFNTDIRHTIILSLTATLLAGLHRLVL